MKRYNSDGVKSYFMEWMVQTLLFNMEK